MVTVISQAACRPPQSLEGSGLSIEPVDDISQQLGLSLEIMRSMHKGLSNEIHEGPFKPSPLQVHLYPGMSAFDVV